MEHARSTDQLDYTTTHSTPPHKNKSPKSSEKLSISSHFKNLSANSGENIGNKKHKTLAQSDKEIFEQLSASSKRNRDPESPENQPDTKKSEQRSYFEIAKDAIGYGSKV